ncbi:hypothetical protein LV89_01811 [Arcicella aurantiaca]|uniref:Uncharacterized protein n=1 Tax=Arcicella aurantiaca TaxID=591202 RepID=A0A316EEB1_9BACT|nr:hypothetical protein [Arcicella aurantiaca]PWK26999.1 hypothetical protein LV89_01811 [Arcicella aurantiaca]
MEELAIIIREPTGGVKIVKIIAEGGVEFWEQNFQIASEAIAFKEEMSDLEHFNVIHTNLLITKLIKQGVITKQGVNVSPLIQKAVELEYARTSWRWSRKKKLIKFFEHEHLKTKGVIQRTIWNRLKEEGFTATWKWLQSKLPSPIKRIIDIVKELEKKIHNE